MKIAVLGGGGFRVPLLARALAGEGPGVRELALFDPDAARLAAIASAARALAPGLRIRETTAVSDAVRGSRFVIAAIRVGGQGARDHDERRCLEAGVLGQETVGAAGAALAMRNIPAAVRLARRVEAEAPGAVLVNYTNPAGMVTEAIREDTNVEVIGICDTPAELTARVAQLLYLDPERCLPGWSGINHLGWLNTLYEEDPDSDDPFPPVDRLRDLYRDPERLLRVHPPGLFRLENLAGALPSEYVFYHLEPGLACRRARAAGTTRGAAILAFEARLFGALGRSGGGARATAAAYQEALAARESSYFRIETGGKARPASPGTRAPAVSGYDRIGLAVIRARSGHAAPTNPVIVVNTGNHTPAGGPAVPELPTGGVVEVSARVGPEGVEPIPQPPLPPAAGRLLRRASAAEREIVQAALTGDAARAATALRRHPAGGAAAAGVFAHLRRPASLAFRSTPVCVP